jgi:hypothetical protein
MAREKIDQVKVRIKACLLDGNRKFITIQSQKVFDLNF